MHVCKEKDMCVFMFHRRFCLRQVSKSHPIHARNDNRYSTHSHPPRTPCRHLALGHGRLIASRVVTCGALTSMLTRLTAESHAIHPFPPYISVVLQTIHIGGKVSFHSSKTGVFYTVFLYSGHARR